MSPDTLLVTAHLAAPLAGDPPQLDALLEWALAYEQPFALATPDGGHLQITRSGPAPPQGYIRIPVVRKQLGTWMVARCSSAVLPECRETVEHVCKRIAVEAAGLLGPADRKIVSTTNSWTKSYRLPLRVRPVRCVRWACFGGRTGILRALRDVRAVGKKVSDGYGRVRCWSVEHAADDYSWYAPHPSGHLLMRVLPVGEWLPKDLVGWRRDFMACCPPYWHPERLGEVAAPC